MSAARRPARLTIGHRLWYRLRLAGLTLFGPAQLESHNDPKMRLEADHRARVDAHRAAKAERRERRRAS
ncbi:hypothetical protein DFJ68_3348 [Terracoccus luteus]|jgi:hypothetical protein|uniref:Uncharacterized protein n=1 Tax=Terracoccus luteus TaxID=53356 RepID=A0A495XZ32_9MICO|nr:hypothetical protein [Terracoccus luteus]RKT79870.1 hypothetical protein DFJ68_3348 [Terracoccus luteus]